MEDDDDCGVAVIFAFCMILKAVLVLAALYLLFPPR